MDNTKGVLPLMTADFDYVLVKICKTLNTEGRKKAVEYHKKDKVTDLRGLWEGYYLLEYGSGLYKKYYKDLNRAFLENDLTKNNATTLTVLENLPSSPSSTKRSRLIFSCLAVGQKISLVQCLGDFLEFCEQRGYILELFRHEPEELGYTIEDIKVHIDPSYIRVRHRPEQIDCEAPMLQSIPLVLPTFITEEESRNREEINLSPLDHYTVPLMGRESQIASMNQFLNHADKGLRILPVIAPSGAGKTRLVTEWLHKHVNKQDWSCGLVESTETKPWNEWTPTRNTLIIIDYVYRFDAVIHAIINQAEKRTDFHIRLIIIDHIFPEKLEELPRFDHYSSALAEDAKTADRRKSLFDDALYLEKQPNRLSMLIDIIVHVSGCNANSAEMHRAKNLLVSFDDNREEYKASAHPLFAILIGEAMKESSQSIENWKRYDVIRYYLDNKRRLPWESSRELNEDSVGKWVGLYIAVATIRRGISFKALNKALASTKALTNADYLRIKSWCNRIVSSGNHHWLKPFEPDILGENFFLLFFRFFAEVPKIHSLFIKMLGLADQYRYLVTDDLEPDLVGRYIEFVRRLAMNLVNDYQDNLNIDDDWLTLADFLAPELYSNDSLLYFAASAANMLVANVLRGRQLHDYIPLFWRQTNKNSLICYSNSEHSKLALEAVSYFFELHPNREKNCVELLEELQFVFKNKFTVLHQAACYNCVELAKAYLTQVPESLDQPNKDGWTPLLTSCFYGHIEFVRFLLNEKVKLNSTINGRSALVISLLNSHFDCAKMLIDTGERLDFIDKYGWSALMVASSYGVTDFVQALIAADVEVNLTNNYGLSALMMASSKGHTSIVKALINSKVALDLSSDDGSSALILAAHNGHLKSVEALICAGAALNLTDNDGWSALMLAASKGHTSIVKALIAAGAKLDFINKGFWSALKLAELNKYKDIAKALKRAGSVLDSKMLNSIAEFLARKDIDSSQNLFFAAQNGEVDNVKHAIEIGAEVNFSNSYGFTPLINAASYGHVDCMKILIKAGALLDWTTKSGLSALTLSARYEQTACMQVLIDAGATLELSNDEGDSLLIIKSAQGDIYWVKALIAAGISLNLTNRDGMSALMLAARNGYVEIVERLIKAGAALNLTCNYKDWYPRLLGVRKLRSSLDKNLIVDGAGVYLFKNSGMSALMFSSAYGQTECLEVLIRARAHLDLTNTDGMSALMFAAAYGHKECLKILIASNVELNLTNKDGVSALMFAAAYGHKECLKILIASNAELNLTNINGMTALMFAETYGHSDCVNALINATALEVGK